ncbi:MAG: T9SS type A sorting domain-containing protein [Elusimicrobiota bacterium]|jgi:hypothetical protein
MIGLPLRYYCSVSSATFSPADFQALEGADVTVTVGGAAFPADGQAGSIEPELGGLVKDASGLAQVVIPPNGVSQSATIDIAPEPMDFSHQLALDALKRQNLASLGAGRDIVMTSSGTLNSAILVLPFDPSLLPAGRDTSHVRVAYFNTTTNSWEVQADAVVWANTVQTQVRHFSIYAPVSMLPSSVAGLRECMVYPNPALRSQNPVVRAFLGVVDSVEVTVFDVSGRLVHSGAVSGAPTGILNGNYYYDYAWTGPKASGVYFAVVHGKTADNTLVRARARFAVIK